MYFDRIRKRISDRKISPEDTSRIRRASYAEWEVVEEEESRASKTTNATDHSARGI